MGDYKVQLDTYQGPLDLLLYLIRREEVDIYDIPIARITEQYIGYVNLLKVLDPDNIADYLVLLATLIEIKSRMLVPRAPAEEGEEEEFEDPRLELVRQLLEYKKFKDAARELGEAVEMHGKRHPPQPLIERTAGEVELDDASVWDLMGAFTRLMAQISQKPALHEVVYDDTPIALHAADMLDRLQRENGALHFERIFLGRTRSEMVGLFLALLELIRQRRVRAEQEHNFGAIIIYLLDAQPILEEEITVVQFPSRPAEEDEATPDTEREAVAPTAEEAFVDDLAGGDDEGEDRELSAIDGVLDGVSERLEDDRRRRRDEQEPPPEELLASSPPRDAEQAEPAASASADESADSTTEPAPTPPRHTETDDEC
jgi:segregation and condensation protein A